MILAKIPGWTRLPRIIAIWVAVCMIYLVATRTSFSREWTSQVQPVTQSNPDGQPEQDLLHEQFQDDVLDEESLENVSVEEPAEPSTEVVLDKTLPGGTVQYDELWEDVHKLPSADYFHSHFDLLRNMKGLTMEEAGASCTWDKYEIVNYQYPGDESWVVTPRPDTEIEQKRREWHKFMETGLLPWQDYKQRFSGRGIVMVGGNELSIVRFKVQLAALKKLGSKIPVEVHYWDNEMDDEKKKVLTDMWPDMTFNDLSNVKTNILHTTNRKPLINFQFKTVALFNSRFEEALLIDSDNIPVIDPMELFESERYKEYGTVFWPDIARTRPQNPAWAITNTKCRMDEYEQESGQMLVDKRRYWYHLQLAAWLNDKTESYYNQYLLGDKDMFRFTWHALKTKYGKPKKWLTSMGTLNGDFFCGHTFAQYHPDNGKVAFLHGGLLKTMTQTVWKYQYDNGGIWQYYKKSPQDENHTHNVDVHLKWDGAEYVPNRPKDIRAAWCTDIKEIDPQPLDDLLPNYDETFREIGGYWEKDWPDYP